jgi:hypothetical protein
MYVYAIQARGFVKIGKANVPEQRMADLQVGNPVQLILRMKIPCKSEKAAEQLEYILQRMFRRFEIRGEWFEYGPIARVLPHIERCTTTDEMCQKIREHFSHQRHKRLQRA